MTNLVPFNDMQQMADTIARSSLFGMKNYEQALALMLVAQAEGQHPATITQEYDIIQGKAARKTHSVLARFQQMGGAVEWHEHFQRALWRAMKRQHERESQQRAQRRA